MAGAPKIIAIGSAVKFHYTLTVEAQIVESSVQGEPLAYVQGEGQMIRGIEKALEGMKAGEKKSFILSAEEGYGLFDPEALLEVPLEKLPESGNVPGSVLSVRDAEGHQMHAIVKDVRGEIAILDFNHPLAGKILEFDVEIIEVT